ncbi:hypothetical protein NMG60_11026188 [Bertholletia excelsa]
MSRSFRLDRGHSMRLERSGSSVLASELGCSEIVRITAYERLSQSAGIASRDCPDGFRRRRKTGAWTLLRKVFSFQKVDGGHMKGRRAAATVAPEEEKKNRRSSWLPDPNRRWPVQGW